MRTRALLLLVLPVALVGCTDANSLASGSTGSGHVWFGATEDRDPDLWGWLQRDTVYTRSGAVYGVDSSFGLTALYGNRPDTAWLTCRGTPLEGGYYALDGSGLLHGRCAAQIKEDGTTWISSGGTLSLKAVEWGSSGYGPRMGGTWQATVDCRSGCAYAGGQRSFTLSFSQVVARTR